MTYFPGAPLYCGRTGSDVIGCRRPTGGVFVCMLQTRVTLTAFPIATPRGRRSKFPRKGIMCYDGTVVPVLKYDGDQVLKDVVNYVITL